MPESNRALFLDRDGVLDELVYYSSSGEWEAPRVAGDIRMIEGVAAPLQRFIDAGWLLFIVTNQPSHAKGKASRESLQAVHDEVVKRLDVPIVRSYVCFHQAEDRCECRKPSPFFLREAVREFGVDLARSWMVGDQDSDLACGRAAGCKVALLEHRGSEHKRGTIEPDLRVDGLEQLANALIPTSSPPP
ncbi:MAG TPA: HAD-IIIA family hydrolase [Thermoanaerobaculia bacterium]|nr:HAD-IIIA family hydrolase [Thermoanaerobaculia bacterium]